MNFDSTAFVADPALREALRPRAVPVDCLEDRILFLQGEEPIGLYIVHSGAATMTIQDDSGEVLIAMPVAPGSLLGLPALVSQKAYSMSARVEKGAEVSFVSSEVFSSLMLTEPMLAMRILRVLAAEVRTARLAAVGR